MDDARRHGERDLQIELLLQAFGRLGQGTDDIEAALAVADRLLVRRLTRGLPARPQQVRDRLVRQPCVELPGLLEVHGQLGRPGCGIGSKPPLHLQPGAPVEVKPAVARDGSERHFLDLVMRERGSPPVQHRTRPLPQQSAGSATTHPARTGPAPPLCPTRGSRGQVELAAEHRGDPERVLCCFAEPPHARSNRLVHTRRQREWALSQRFKVALPRVVFSRSTPCSKSARMVWIR